MRPHLKVAALAPEHNPDAALLALKAEIDAADQAWEARAREVDVAEDALFAMPKKPRATKPAMNDNSGPFLSAAASQAAEKRARAEFFLKAAEEAQNAADDVRIAICNLKIIPMRATTLAGLIFKARYAASHFPGDPDEDVMRSIVQDLLAMGGEAFHVDA